MIEYLRSKPRRQTKIPERNKFSYYLLQNLFTA